MEASCCDEFIPIVRFPFLVFQIYIAMQRCSPAAARYRDVIECALLSLPGLGLSRIVWRPNWGILKEEGVLQPESVITGDDGEDHTAAAAAVGPAAAGSGDAGSGASGVQSSALCVDGEGDEGEEVVVVCEGGVRYAAAPLGQKTGAAWASACVM